MDLWDFEAILVYVECLPDHQSCIVTPCLSGSLLALWVGTSKTCWFCPPSYLFSAQLCPDESVSARQPSVVTRALDFTRAHSLAL